MSLFRDAQRATLVSPDLDPSDLPRLQAFWKLSQKYDDRLQASIREISASVPGLAAIVDQIAPEQQEAERAESLRLQDAAINQGDWVPYLRRMHDLGTQYAQLGMSFSDWMSLAHGWLMAIVDIARDAYDQGDPAAMDAVQGANRFAGIAMAAIGESYLATKEEVIVRQQEAISELSTPVLQVADHLLVMPMVGGIDTHRARELTETMLHAIRDRRAHAVVIDVTGVPIVDSRVATHLLQAVEAGRLMGARVIVTGISAEIAMTMVSMGANLPGVPTAGDLQAGLELAQRYLADLPGGGPET